MSSTPDPTKPVAIIDIEALAEDWDNDPDLTPEQVSALRDLPQEQVREALEGAVGDFFWREFHLVLSGATRHLLNALSLSGPGVLCPTPQRTAGGWVVEVCDNPDCEESAHLFPPLGTAVAVLAKANAREVGEDDTYDVGAGASGVVEGYVAEWHDVHVRFESGLNLWIDPCNLTNAPTPKETA